MVHMSRHFPNIEARPSARFCSQDMGHVSVSGVIPVRALLVGGSNQSNSMAETDVEGHDVVVKDHLIGGCRVKVVKNMEEGVFRVVRPKTDEVLAVFSFNASDRHNMTRSEAEQRAEEYAHGYVSGYNDGLEN